MSYTSQNDLASGTNIRRVIEVIELLGFEKINDGLRVPDRVRAYFWYNNDDFKSYTGIELSIYSGAKGISVTTRSRVSRSYWDLKHQNETIRLLKNLFGGNFQTDAGTNRCWRVDGRPPSPLSSGCYLAQWRFRNGMQKAQLYHSSRNLGDDVGRDKPTGLYFLDAMNPRLLSNNLLIPYVIAVWEEYFRSSFAVILKYANKRDTVLKKARLSHIQLEQIAGQRRPIEQAISECFSFQRPSLIGENFRMLDNKLDLAAAFRRPYKRRKVSLFDSIEALVEGRNAFVHAGDMDMTLYDQSLSRTLTDVDEAVARAYTAIGLHFGFTPQRN